MSLAIRPSLTMISSWLVILTIGSRAFAVQADAPPVAVKPPKVERLELVISPADEVRPALKYQFLPSPDQRKPGNAAPFYYRSIVIFEQVPENVHQQYTEKSASWVLSNDELPLEEMKTYVAAFGFALGELREAVYRERCDWDFQLGRLEGTDGISFLLPELQPMRNLARVLVIKARIEIAERRFDDAIESLRLGFQMARDAARPKTLINALVGIAICQYMNGVIEEFINTPGSPNLYWAVASLPRPMIDMREAFDQEMTLPVRMFPILKDPVNAQRSENQWQRMFVDAVSTMRQLGNGQGKDEKGKSAADQTEALMAKAFPAAKQELLDAGFDMAKVSAMPRGQVLAIKAVRDYRHCYHEFLKWTRVPYPLSVPRIHQVETKLKQDGYFGDPDSKQVLPIASFLMPSVEKAYMAQARLDTHLAMLQTIEAIRIYAAQKQLGSPMDEAAQFPGSLDDLQTHPAADNPLDGKAFPFELIGDTVETWFSSSSGNETLDIRQYSITISKIGPLDL